MSRTRGAGGAAERNYQRRSQRGRELVGFRGVRGALQSLVLNAEADGDAANHLQHTVQNPLRWQGPAEWRLDYLNAARLSPEEIARRRAENDQIKAVAQGVRDAAIKA